MEKTILGTQMPCGHPFTENQINTIFNVKPVTSRWRKQADVKKTFSYSKNAYVSDSRMLSLKSFKKFGFSPVNMLLTVPELRELLSAEWKPSWPDACAPELYIINRYSKQFKGKPYFTLNGDSVRSGVSEPEIIEAEEFPYEEVAVYFMSALNDGPLDVAPLLKDVFKTIFLEPNTDLAHKALWAICSNYGCSLPIQFILHKHPELAHFYDFLDWYTITDVFEPEDNIQGHRIDYSPEFNFYAIYPKSLHSGFVTESVTGLTERFVSDAARQIMAENKKSVFHSHHEISDCKELIMEVIRTEKSLDSYFKNHFEDIIGFALKPIEDYIRSRKPKPELQEAFGEKEIPVLDTTCFEEVKKLIFNTQKNHMIVVMAIEDAHFKEIIKDISQSFHDPLAGTADILSQYKELSKDPIKNRHRIAELLDDMEKVIDKEIENIEAWDKIFYLLINKLNNLIANYIPTGVISDEVSDDSEQRSEIEALSSKIKTLESHYDEAILSIDEKESEIQSLKERLTSATKESSDRVIIEANESSAIKSLIENSAVNPEQILQSLSLLYPNQLVVMESAYEAAKASANFKQTVKMFDLINTLVVDYLPAILNGKADTEARKCFGTKAYAANESHTVSNSTKLMRHRQFTNKGEKIEMQQHLNIGTAHDSSQTMRIYFKIIDSKIYLGYAGRHLPNE